MTCILDSCIPICQLQPSGVFLKPLEIQIQFEELSLEDNDGQDDAIECEAADSDMKMESLSEQTEAEEPDEGKRSYRQFCMGKDKKQFKICHSLAHAIKRPKKRVNI